LRHRAAACAGRSPRFKAATLALPLIIIVVVVDDVDVDSVSLVKQHVVVARDGVDHRFSVHKYCVDSVECISLPLAAFTSFAV
jgi:hypothetical protein